MKLEKILSIPKSLWFCLHYFTIKDAIKLPVIVRYNTKLNVLKGRIILSGGGKDSNT